jgi:carbon monoxide dehydrogenase subunit G
MKLAAAYELPFPREQVFSALTNPDILLVCIPGCESLAQEAENVYRAALSVGLPGLKGKYSGRASLSDLNPPDSFRIAVDGKGGAGFVKGSGLLRLSDVENGTRVECEAEAHVGGVLAAVGQRLVSAGAKQMMDAFFQRVHEKLSPAP